ncbi:hypothetical protein F4779DRAFT_601171 [Xylariaceae sp. FL0662B]|nr:hypothetical protein F4779DRAFT_601171 [Xylariaceae sp. FL0662B]
MDRIPLEVLLNIFHFLDGPAPSEVHLHDQPSDSMLDVTAELPNKLKSVSLVCKTWRSLVLPDLFRHILWRPKLSSLSAFTLNPIPLLRFLVDNRLDRRVITFTLLVDFVDKEADFRRITPEIRPVDLEWLWDQLFSVIDPLRFTIIAPPTTLAAFLSRMLYLDDAWSFSIPYHILSLARASRGPLRGSPSNEQQEGHATDLQVSSENGTAGSSRSAAVSPRSCSARHKKPPACPLFTARPWTSILLNEGSSAKVYRVYEFFLRTPPSMLGALLGCEEYPNDTPLLPPTIVDFNYIAVFPLSSHFEILLHNLPKLDRLFVQLTPRPGNRMLDDKEEMKHIEPADFWMERNTTYSFIMRELTAIPKPRGNWATLQVFESGDTADREAWERTVEFIQVSGIKDWKVEREGVLVRQSEDGNTPITVDLATNGHSGGSVADNPQAPNFLDR